MPAWPLPQERVDAFVAEITRAIQEDGASPVGPWGTGRKSPLPYACERLGLTRNQGVLLLRRAKEQGAFRKRVRVPAGSDAATGGLVGGPPIPPAAVPPEGFVVFRNSGQYDEAGKLTKQWVGSKRGPGDTFEVLPGHAIKGESALLDADGRILARWVKTKEGAGGDLVASITEALSEYDIAAPVVPAPSGCVDDMMTVYPLPDLHFGAYAWGPETGADYDTDIAQRVATETIAALVEQSPASRRAVVLVLGDYFHQNDQKNATPGSGHQLDVDGRWARVYERGAYLLADLVNRVAQKHHEVEVKILPGNHDESAAVTLGVALSMYFGKSDRITVNLTPGVFWYRRFGAVLLGATHGHTVKPDRAAMAMAADRAADWGLSRHRHVFMGHIHTETAKEVAGVRVESFQAPTARDGWNAASGYRSGRSLTAITFHAERGEIGRHYWAIAA